ncbi:conserved hypothetical protein [Planktothrix serta PCC 8927]|uniref:Uncharacterized protein n=2 Tax=Planktothrix TaxID=54304 RepID=A0A7Z9BUX2_9CYAN|nr:conserved hypothetical protein [Planktothrix serta PCC 8927]
MLTLAKLSRSTMNTKDEMFTEASNFWDLQKLYQDLEAVKRLLSPRSRQGLTETEKLYLRGLLCGYSPAEIAKKLFQSPKSVEVYLCKTLYPYLKNLLEVPSEVGNWRNICNWLNDAGYKKLSSGENLFNNLLPQETLVKIVNVDFLKENTISIDINLQLHFPSNLNRDESKNNIDE